MSPSEHTVRVLQSCSFRGRESTSIYSPACVRLTHKSSYLSSFTGNRIKQRVEELEKEVNEYRRRAQEQQTTSDESHNGSETGAPNANGSTSNTPDNSPGHIGGDAMTRCSSNSPGSVNGKGTPSSNSNEDMSKDNINKDKSCNGGGSSNSSISGSSNYAIEMDTDGDSRLNGAASHASPVSATLLPHSNPVIQPQCLTQAPRPQQMAPQLTFAPFPGMTSPPLPQPYALAPDWPWTGAPGGIYRDAMGQQPLTGKPILLVLIIMTGQFD